MFKKIISYALSTALIFETSIGWGQKPTNPPHVLYESAKEYMKDTGLDKKNITFKEWFKKASKYLDPEVGGKIQRWVSQNPNKKMPTFEITKGKKTDDKIVLNIVVKLDGKSLAFDFVQTETDVYFVLQGRRYNHSDLYYGNLVDNTFGHSPLMSLHKIKSIAKSHPRTAAKYFQALRDYMVSYEQYQDVFRGNGKDKKVSLWEHLLPASYADGDPDDIESTKNGGYSISAPCIVAGWPDGNLKSNGSCLPPAEATGHPECSTGYVCNPAMFGNGPSNKGLCVPQGPASEVSLNCRKNSKDNIDKIIDELYAHDTTSYSRFNTSVEDSFKRVFNTCINSSSIGSYNQALKKGDSKFFANLDLNKSITREIKANCVNKSNCNEHNKIACEQTVGRIAELLRQPVPKSAPGPCDGGIAQQNPQQSKTPSKTVATDTGLCPGEKASGCTPSQKKDGCGSNGVTPIAVSAGEQSTAESAGDSSSGVGNFFSNYWPLLLTGGVAFAAGYATCRLWLCKDAITKTVTNTINVPVPVDVPGPTQYVNVPGETITKTVEVPGPTVTQYVDKIVEVPGPIQYLVPPVIPVPQIIPEETVIPRPAGQGAN
jgi:hypothetical protein